MTFAQCWAKDNSMPKSSREELAVLIRDNLDFWVSVDNEASVFGNADAAADAILAAFPSLGYARRDEVLEEAAGIVDAECERILSKQTPNATPGSTNGDINQNLRMVAVMLPEIANAIRALKSPAPSQENP